MIDIIGYFIAGIVAVLVLLAIGYIFVRVLTAAYYRSKEEILHFYRRKRGDKNE